MLGDVFDEQRRGSKDKTSFPETGATYTKPMQVGDGFLKYVQAFL